MAVRVITTTHLFFNSPVPLSGTDILEQVRAARNQEHLAAAERLARHLENENIDRVCHSPDIHSLILAKAVGAHHGHQRIVHDDLPAALKLFSATDFMRELIRHYDGNTLFWIAPPVTLKSWFCWSRDLPATERESVRVAPYSVSIFTVTARAIQLDKFNESVWQ